MSVDDVKKKKKVQCKNWNTCMWLCNDEVEEKPRLHTVHLNGLLELDERTSTNQGGILCPFHDSQMYNS